jgi:kynurenine formamidase
MTGRGVLLDYADWAATNSVSVSALESEAITLDNLKKVVKDHKLEFRQGDILFIRSGFTVAYNSLSEQQRIEMPNRPNPDFSGVEATEGMVRWLWEHQFAAVGGDAPSFERAPIRGSHADSDYNIHEWVLAGWGTPIGEMFDLEKLAAHCKATGRYSFFLSSMPLKVCLVILSLEIGHSTNSIPGGWWGG